MKKVRLERYLDKIQIIEENLDDMQSWINDITDVDYQQIPKKEKYAIFHAFQIIVEAISDISVMILKDIGKVPKDDYSNLDLLGDSNIISQKILQELKYANGLRNRIVHEYNGIVDKLAFHGIEKHSEIFLQYVELISQWLNQAL
ncbi:MAG: DUF86 domain-containing protein [Candidatus Lokiarchaeota archaeon]|nr:DUF86 domain-containing protein [Candidatus Harpocratesius repetitus]